MRCFSESVKAEVMRQMSLPIRQSVVWISEELSTHVFTHYNYRNAWLLQREVLPASEKEPWGCPGFVDRSIGVMP